MTPHLTLAALLLTGAVAGAALAQTPAPGYGPPSAGAAPGGYAAGGPGAGGMRAGLRERFRQGMEARRARRDAELRAVLQLRPDQEAAYAQFTAAIQPPPLGENGRGENGRDRMGPGGRDGMQDATMTTPERLARMQTRMQERQAAFARRADAVRRFYAVLSPAQQKAFDAVAEHMLHAGGMHRWGRGGHQGPEGGPR